MKVTLIQMNSVADKLANIAAARALIERAVAEEGPDWILLPEQFDWAGGVKGDKAKVKVVLLSGTGSSTPDQGQPAYGISVKRQGTTDLGPVLEAQCTPRFAANLIE